MSKSCPPLVVVSIDGARAELATYFSLFDGGARHPNDTGMHKLRTVFPSSTAAAHASFLTGATPAVHGVIANRYWAGSESVATIVAANHDPLSTFRPYDRASTGALSIIQACLDNGRTVAAVHFPGTLSPLARVPGVEAAFCLYAAARELQVDPAGEASLEYFGDTVRVSISPPQSGHHHVTIGDSKSIRCVPHEFRRISFTVDVGQISVAVATGSPNEPPRLRLGTAVLTMTNGEHRPSTQDLSKPGLGPASRAVSYDVGQGSTLFEAPRAAWVTATALDYFASVDPDVMFVRYNQIDHAQEELYSYATSRCSPASAKARETLLRTHILIDSEVAKLIEALPAETNFLIFSDHGIAAVDRLIRPNRVLRDIGRHEQAVFQGDSNIAFLYGELEESALKEVIHRLNRHEPTARLLEAREIRRLGLPSPDRGSMGLAILEVGPGCELVYDHDGLGRETVSIGAHGLRPDIDSMHGIFRAFGPDVLPTIPKDITECRAIIAKMLGVP